MNTATLLSPQPALHLQEMKIRRLKERRALQMMIAEREESRGRDCDHRLVNNAHLIARELEREVMGETVALEMQQRAA